MRIISRRISSACSIGIVECDTPRREAADGVLGQDVGRMLRAKFEWLIVG